ncbi:MULTISPECIES: alpha/beta hydrolase [unclassified Nocardioides]|uniref:alpha/beta hydrolase n=1 Tax=unclassified Nocardioides TaxID=2615069 RepID=UPI0006F3A546|nr:MULTISPECIES: alpha/beta hydrolase [unclassified Nocardioides]KQY63649.1 alpha/beta hydrolase [Nocardioides sp. Root140]KQZ67547.1 alpha/beta hydrolase [Nocardioides sp. Root151]KRF15665.1 alpha/beta hydrolase [Nocardioides sp. Soil796]
MLYPQARRAVEAQAGVQPVNDPSYDIAAARAEARAVAARQPREDVAEVRDVDAGGVPCRFYRPASSTAGLVVHLHGGGFVFNDVDVHDAACRRLANRSGLAVLSVDYRRPPEHRFPAAPDDVDTVLAWLEENFPLAGQSWLTYDDAQRRDRIPVFVHGDSAGANLALVAALRHPGRFAGVALIYPFLDPTGGFESYETAAEGFDRAEAQWYWEQYAATPADHTDPDFAPLLAKNLDTLPPTLVVTAEHDPLRDEGEHLAHLLAESGVQVVASRQLGMVHGFWRHPDAFDAAEPLTRQVAGFLRMLV